MNNKIVTISALSLFAFASLPALAATVSSEFLPGFVCECHCTDVNSPSTNLTGAGGSEDYLTDLDLSTKPKCLAQNTNPKANCKGSLTENGQTTKNVKGTISCEWLANSAAENDSVGGLSLGNQNSRH